MTTAAAWSVALIGLEGAMVEVEVADGVGLPRTVLVGLPDAALSQAKDRVRAAIAGAGMSWPSGAVTINLSPAHLPKAGTHFDLAIAAAAMAVRDAQLVATARNTVFLGELGLDGRVRPVPGILPALLAASKAGFTKATVPAPQAAEAQLVPGITVWPVSHLGDLVEVLSGRPTQPAVEASAPAPPPTAADFRDVQGHPDGRWVMEVAAAGRHHVYLHGAPGVGKTMLASRLPGILPPLEGEEAVEVSALHSLAGIDLSSGWLRQPPYADPHHSSTLASIVGGGAKMVRPGAISLAHRGVLFLDEAPEFGSRVLDALRTPLECGWVSIGRANAMVRYPARFQLVLAANPCPCGFHGVAGRQCRCAPMTVRRYQERLSGPVLDRIDIRHHMAAQPNLISQPEAAEPSSAIADRVLLARERAAHRLRDSPWKTNGEIPGPWLRRNLPPPQRLDLLEQALTQGRLSARGVDKVLRIAWTICDLEGAQRISTQSLRIAMQLRQGEYLGAA